MRQTTELAAVRHVSGSGDLERWWEFLPAGGFPAKPARLLLSVRVGGERLEFEVPICTNRSPLTGARIVVPIDDETWRLTPTVWRGDRELADVEPLHERLAVGSVLLMGTPAHVSAEIYAIGANERR